MVTVLNLEFDYINHPHLLQIYTGLSILKAKNILKLNILNTHSKLTNPILKIRINKKYNVVFDTLDGFNWINDSISNNLEYFRNNFKDCDYYFKRSFSDILLNYKPDKCKVYPFGFNYLTYPHIPLVKRSIKNSIKYFVLKNNFTSKLLKIKTREYNSENFEFLPVLNKDIKILFQTRLWNPEEVSDPRLKKERDLLNYCRVKYIKICKAEYGDNFTGGISDDPFSRDYDSSVVIPNETVKKDRYIDLLKSHHICIATTGLHNSIGWKFGEYIAASRAIVSEPLFFSVPGNFQEGKNYLKFSNHEELIEKINLLANNRKLLQEIMLNNLFYYNNFVKPELLVWNALQKSIFS